MADWPARRRVSPGFKEALGKLGDDVELILYGIMVLVRLLMIRGLWKPSPVTTTSTPTQSGSRR